MQSSSMNTIITLGSFHTCVTVSGRAILHLFPMKLGNSFSESCCGSIANHLFDDFVERVVILAEKLSGSDANQQALKVGINTEEVVHGSGNFRQVSLSESQQFLFKCFD